MATRSRVPTSVWLSNLPRMVFTAPREMLSAAGLQFAKETFQLRRPRGAKDGRPDKLRQISLRITDVCNLRCHTCGQWGDNGYLIGQTMKDLRQRELPLETYERLVDEVKDAKCAPLWYIWGGEPMMYPKLFDLLQKITDKKMAVTMVTNGTGIAAKAEQVMDTCKVLWLSLDGPDAETHNASRPGAVSTADNFASVSSALETLHEEKKRKRKVFPLTMPITVVNRYNIEQLPQIYELSSKRADGHIFYLSWWIDEQAAQNHTRDFEQRFGFEPWTHLGWQGDWMEFDYERLHEQLEKIRAMGRKKGNCPVMIFPDLQSPEMLREYYTDHTQTFGYRQCVSIYMCMEINSNGDVSLCRDYHDYVIGNISQDSFSEIWEGEVARKFRSSISNDGLMPVCHRCCGLMGF